MTWLKRIFLFMAVNMLVLLTLSVTLQLLGVGPYLSARGIDYGSLMAFCLVWGMGGSFVSLALSRVMAKRTMGVEVLDPASGHELLAIVRRLTERAGLPMPEVGVYRSPEPNAFATGPTRGRALVAVSTGLLEVMDQGELEGVLGHEISHVANGDMVTLTLLQGVVNAFVMFLARAIAFAMARDDREDESRGASRLTVFLLEIALGFLGMIVVAWFSRWREFRADAGSARLGGKEKMIAALRALQRRFEPRDDAPAYAAFKIAGGPGIMGLFSTHPPLEARIAALR